MRIFDIERPFQVMLCYGFVPDIAEKEHFCPYYSARYQPSRASVPVDYDSNYLMPRIVRAYLKSLWQRCHSLFTQARCAKPPHSVLTEVSLSSADHRSGKCQFPFSPLFDRYIPDSEDAYDPIGGGCDLLVWIVMATSCFGSLQMFCLRYCLFSCQGAFEDRISPLSYIVFNWENRKNII